LDVAISDIRVQGDAPGAVAMLPGGALSAGRAAGGRHRGYRWERRGRNLIQASTRSATSRCLPAGWIAKCPMGRGQASNAQGRARGPDGRRATRGRRNALRVTTSRFRANRHRSVRRGTRRRRHPLLNPVRGLARRLRDQRERLAVLARRPQEQAIPQRHLARVHRPARRWRGRWRFAGRRGL